VHMELFDINFVKIADPFGDEEKIVETNQSVSEHPMFDGLEYDEGDDETDWFPKEPTSGDDVQITRGIITSSGILPVTQDWNPYSGYYGHTNFIITKKLKLVIQNQAGVESIKILSPYRFKISFGRYFADQEAKIQTNIVKALQKYQHTVYNN